MKIGLIANSSLWLQPFATNLSLNHEVWWCVFEKEIYDLLLLKGAKNIFFEEDKLNLVVTHLGNKYRYSDPGNTEKNFINAIRPNIIITDVSTRLSNCTKDCIWIYTAHSFCYKKYTFHESLLKFDGIIIPGRYYLDEFPKRLQVDHSFPILIPTGFPKLDLLHNFKNNRAQILHDIKFDPYQKVGLYAPTWGGSTSKTEWGNALFPRWSHRDHLAILEKLLASLYESGIQMIIKPHHVAVIDMKEQISIICKKYGAFFVTDTPTKIADPFEYIIASDFLISDLSGIILEFLALDKPVVFIEPESNTAWDDSSIPPTLRFGGVVDSVESLILESISAAESGSDYYKNKRQFVKEQLLTFDSPNAIEKSIHEIFLHFPTQ